MPYHFLAIGELLADVITTDYCDSLQEAKIFELFPGGSPGNVACNISFLGKKSALITCIGDDGIGRFLKGALEQVGVNTDYIQISNSHPTSIVLVTRSRGTPDFMAYRGADAQLGAIEKETIAGASIVHTTAFALSRQPSQGVILAALETAKNLDKKIFIDWNFAPAIWGADDGNAVFEQVMRLRPFLKISVDDLKRFCRKSLDIPSCKAFLDACTAAVVCLTCGKEGTWYKEENGPWIHVTSLPVAEVKDTTGAGDAFWAGFAVAYLDQLSIAECVSNGSQVAARKIQKMGPLYG